MVRTRELLIDVARQLFARQGVAATTMNDIAEASGKGRRTIYTYFKNKNEIYWAVVEAESKHLYARLEGLTNRDLPPEENFRAIAFPMHRAAPVITATFPSSNFITLFFIIQGQDMRLVPLVHISIVLFRIK